MENSGSHNFRAFTKYQIHLDSIHIYTKRIHLDSIHIYTKRILYNSSYFHICFFQLSRGVYIIYMTALIQLLIIRFIAFVLNRQITT